MSTLLLSLDQKKKSPNHLFNFILIINFKVYYRLKDHRILLTHGDGVSINH